MGCCELANCAAVSAHILIYFSKFYLIYTESTVRPHLRDIAVNSV